MVDYDPHIHIDPLTPARDGYFFVKDIEIEHSPLGKVETPFKIIDARGINEDMANQVKKLTDKHPIFENWKFINRLSSFDGLYKILKHPGRDQISELDRFFDLKKKVWNSSHTVLSVVFQRNPFERNQFKSGYSTPLTWKDFTFLLDYIHTASNAFVLVPDIKIDESMNLNSYINYVDNAVSILSTFNNKPIFVPVPIKLNQDEFEKLIKTYKYRGYTNLWIDFHASQISSTQFTRVRYLLRNIEKYLNLNRTVLYFSHVRKEINRHILDKKTTASNALAPFIGCDFLGIYREPQRGGSGTNKEDEMNYIIKNKFKNKQELEMARVLNRTRLFDPETYYYYNINEYPQTIRNIELLKKDAFNRMFNSISLYNEINNARKFVDEHKNVGDYIDTKLALKREPELAKELYNGSKEQSKLFDFFNKI